VRSGRALVLSEEGPEAWLRRGERLDLAGHVHWLCRPFRGKPRPAEWQGLLEELAALHARRPFDLLAAEPRAEFLPGRSENDPGAVLEALLPLRRLTERGVAVLLLHHPRKGRGLEGQSARGSGALSGHVDILVEMHWFTDAADGDRRRRLDAW